MWPDWIITNGVFITVKSFTDQTCRPNTAQTCRHTVINEGCHWKIMALNIYSALNHWLCVQTMPHTQFVMHMMYYVALTVRVEVCASDFRQAELRGTTCRPWESRSSGYASHGSCLLTAVRLLVSGDQHKTCSWSCKILLVPRTYYHL